MLIVGSSLARAFGIVGVASLIRYRAKIDDPKDAVVMLATLTVGLCCGVELYGLALFSTLFILAILWVVESLEPEQRKTFELKVVAPDPAALRPEVEADPAPIRTSRSSCAAPARRTWCTRRSCRCRCATDRIANAILQLQEGGETEVSWEEKKKK